MAREIVGFLCVVDPKLSENAELRALLKQEGLLGD